MTKVVLKRGTPVDEGGRISKKGESLRLEKGSDVSTKGTGWMIE